VVFLDNLLLTTGIGTNVQAEPTISLFPNPAADQLRITASEAIEMITLFNAHGQQVAQYPMRGLSGVIDLSALQSGVYSLHASSGGSSFVRQVVKE
jgi:hypothetical protein